MRETKSNWDMLFEASVPRFFGYGWLLGRCDEHYECLLATQRVERTLWATYEYETRSMTTMVSQSKEQTLV